jgi:anion-transporting  ArsA/GET3 family ATPase
LLLSAISVQAAIDQVFADRDNQLEPFVFKRIGSNPSIAADDQQMFPGVREALGALQLNEGLD